MENVFQLVKKHITTKDAVVHYGFHPNRSGLICCPFHHDQNPSMKVDKRFYCFGCGASGDVIDFVEKYFDLPVKDAALKLVEDFGLLEDAKNVTNGKFIKKTVIPKELPGNQEEIPKECLVREITKAFCLVVDYTNILKQWKEVYKPASIDDPWDEHFIEAVDNLATSEFIVDGLLLGSKDEITEFYCFYKEEVNRIGQRIVEIRTDEDYGKSDYK